MASVKMREQKIALSKAQSDLAGLPDCMTEKGETLIVTRGEVEVLAILSYSTYTALLETIEALQETIEIMRDEEAVASLHESIQAFKRGETTPWEDIKQQLDLTKNKGEQE